MFEPSKERGWSKRCWTMAIYAAGAILCVLWVACGDGDGEDGQPYASGSYHGESGLRVEAVFAPDPPQVGAVDLSLELFIDTEPLEGAWIEVDPWMPEHGHGSDTRAIAIEEGGGLYSVDELSFSMPGAWELELIVQWADRVSVVIVDIEVEG